MGFKPPAMRSSCSDESTDMQHDLCKSGHDLDLIIKKNKHYSPLFLDSWVIPRRVGAGRQMRRARGVWTPSLTRLIGHVATMEFDKKQKKKIMIKLPKPILRSGQRSDHQMSSKVKFLSFQHFSTNRCNSGTRRATAKTSAFDGSFDALFAKSPQIWPKING